MLIGECIRIIKRRYVNRKSLGMIDDIVLYTHKGEVYKVVIRYCELLIKPLKKLGIDNYIIILEEFPKVKITDDLVKNCTKYENLTIIYNNHSCISTVVSGEDKTPSLNF